jgi:hypothetical protein
MREEVSEFLEELVGASLLVSVCAWLVILLGLQR